MARRKRMHGKRRHKSSCPPFKMHHTEEALLNNPDISVQQLEQDHGLSTDTHDLRVLEDGTKVWKRKRHGKVMPPLLEYIKPVEFKKYSKLEPFNPSRAPSLGMKTLEAKPIEQPPISQELKTGGVSVADTLPRKRFENKPYYTMRSSGFQVQTATSIWDEKTRSWKQRRMEPEEIQYQEDQIKKHINKKKGNR